MKLLAVDTATEACSAALMVDGKVYTEYQHAPRQHAQLILPFVEKLLVGANLGVRDLDGVVYGKGPGSFTGLRIAVATAQGLAMAADCQLVGISTLQALARQAFLLYGHTKILSAIDARMKQIYAGWYHVENEDKVTLIQEESVLSAEALSIPVTSSKGDWQVYGSACPVYTEALRARNLHVDTHKPVLYPRASDMLPLAIPLFSSGSAHPPEAALPVYLRNQVAHPKPKSTSL